MNDDQCARMKFIPELEIGASRDDQGYLTLTFRNRRALVALLAEAQGLLADWDREYPS